MFRPQIVELLHERDAIVAEWQKQHQDVDAFEDQRLDLPSSLEISVGKQICAVQAALDARG